MHTVCLQWPSQAYCCIVNSLSILWKALSHKASPCPTCCCVTNNHAQKGKTKLVNCWVFGIAELSLAFFLHALEIFSSDKTPLVQSVVPFSDNLSFIIWKATWLIADSVQTRHTYANFFANVFFLSLRSSLQLLMKLFVTLIVSIDCEVDCQNLLRSQSWDWLSWSL